MLDMSLLAQAAEKIETQNQDHQATAETCYQEALEILDAFQQHPRRGYLLKEAAELLVDSIYYQRTRVEPYLKLASIFFILNQDRLATKYLLAAKKVQPHHPEIQRLQTLLIKQARLAS